MARGDSMTLTRRKGRFSSSIADRVRWLLEHPELWKDWTGHQRSPKQQEIVLAMQDAGLLSRKTYWPDVNLHALIHLAIQVRLKKLRLPPSM